MNSNEFNLMAFRVVIVTSLSFMIKVSILFSMAINLCYQLIIMFSSGNVCVFVCFVRPGTNSFNLRLSCHPLREHTSTH